MGTDISYNSGTTGAAAVSFCFLAFTKIWFSFSSSKEIQLPLFPGLCSQSPHPHTHTSIFHCVAINQTCNHIRVSSFFLWPLLQLFLFSPESLAQRKGRDNCDISYWIVPESTTWPQRPSGRVGGVLSAVHSRQVKAEWSNCLPFIS